MIIYSSSNNVFENTLEHIYTLLTYKLNYCTNIHIVYILKHAGNGNLQEDEINRNGSPGNFFQGPKNSLVYCALETTGLKTGAQAAGT